MRRGSMHPPSEDVSVVYDKACSTTEIESAGLCTSRLLPVEDVTSSNCDGAVDSVSLLRIVLESECTFR